ncbi:MAG: hypothetical protein LC099_11890 [Anaerolineales bacterium]|nr:hypothetical protein [Anaerolineales bacterium]
MNFIKKHFYSLLGLFFFALSLFIRYRLRGFINIDTDIIIGWYKFIQQHGIRALADDSFANYPPAYLYLLWFSTLFAKWFSPLISIKIIPTAFDFFSAFTIYKIAKEKFSDDKPFLLSGLFFLLPTVMLNSSTWGQIDSLYVSFLLVCFYFLLKKKSLLAMLAFSVALAFKAQTIFFLPFLGVLVLRKQLQWFLLFIAPVAYFLFAIPTLLLGRSWNSLLFLYSGQVDQFQELSKAAPNLYLFIPNVHYHPVLEIGLTVFALCMALWAWSNWKAGASVRERQFVLTALASLALVPFLLPKMHDRYFYPADVFSFVVALFIPQLWFLPLLYQIMSSLTYSIFLFHGPTWLINSAVFINSALVFYIMRAQIKSLGEPSSNRIQREISL